MISLSRRSAVAGSVWAILVFAFGTLALLAIFDRITISRFDDVLAERLTRLTVELSNADAALNADSMNFSEPGYGRQYSGKYWQFRESDGQIVASASLFDFNLNLPEPVNVEPLFWETSGPRDAVRGLTQLITLENGKQYQVAVAESLKSLSEDRQLVSHYGAVTFLILGFLGVVGAYLLTSSALRPLRKLSGEVQARWSDQSKLDPEKYPAEVAPLVSDINTLLERNHDIIARARRQTADMAHALKTPVSALKNELEAMSDQGLDVSLSEEILERIEKQVSRALARMRASYSADGMRMNANVRGSIDRLKRLFETLPIAMKKQLIVSCDAGLSVKMDRQDLEEIIGNILENGYRWAAKTLSIKVTQIEEFVTIEIEDDGPGLTLAESQQALLPGQRLDMKNEGTGLGLAIASDLVAAYGGTIDLERSESLGGLLVKVKVPTSHRAQSLN